MSLVAALDPMIIAWPPSTCPMPRTRSSLGDGGRLPLTVAMLQAILSLTLAVGSLGRTRAHPPWRSPSTDVPV